MLIKFIYGWFYYSTDYMLSSAFVTVALNRVTKRVLELGCYSTVVGSAIARPQLITKSYVEEFEKPGKLLMQN